MLCFEYNRTQILHFLSSFLFPFLFNFLFFFDLHLLFRILFTFHFFFVQFSIFFNVFFFFLNSFLNDLSFLSLSPGERTKLSFCTSCCTDDYCNVGNSSSRRSSQSKFDHFIKIFTFTIIYRVTMSFRTF